MLECFLYDVIIKGKGTIVFPGTKLMRVNVPIYCAELKIFKISFYIYFLLFFNYYTNTKYLKEGCYG